MIVIVCFCVCRTKGFEKFYHTCEEIGRGTQGVTYFVQQIVPIEADQSGHHCVEEAESKYWWLHRSVKPSAPTVDPVMVPYRFTGNLDLNYICQNECCVKKNYHMMGPA